VVPGLVDAGPDQPVELGVRFTADTDGYIASIRFYKSDGNTGTHVGNLWTNTGTLLASATFANETASGWQEVSFAIPVPISANTVYVASYHTDAGHYSADRCYFTSAGVDQPPLHALPDWTSGGNGVYAYGPPFRVASATPQTAQDSVAVKYASAQTAGDLNVVVVGWNDTTATVSSVTDTSGNVYTRAVGPTTVAGKLSQSIYYAKNVAAAVGGNTVIVNFSQAAQFPDIRILEYGGIDTTSPVDVTAGASGTGTTSDSGAATTGNANDLIFGANTVTSTTTAAGTGFTSRVITSPDGDIAEDQVVTATGSYRATAALTSGSWVMQMVAFRAAGGTQETQRSFPDQTYLSTNYWVDVVFTGTGTGIDDDNPCTADSYDPILGPLHVPLSAGTPCSDGNACNGLETCDGAGMCLAGAPSALDDGNPCTADACDPAGGVTHAPLPTGISCSDGNACNGVETCDGAGVCLAGAPLVVDDGNPCTADACDPAGGVTHSSLPAGTSCSGGNACDGAACNGTGTCVAGTAPALDDGNPCTIDSCDPARGVVHTPATPGTSCSDGNACNGEETCNAAGACVASTPPSVDDGDACTADACYPGVGIVHSPIPSCGALPPDPATVAPPTDRTVATDIASATAFLYTGSNPIQTGVPDGIIDPRRVAVLRGHVNDREGSPVGGVKISVKVHPEFGSTLTRADGMFDMAVNGGGQLTVDYQKDGYLPAQRQVQAPWRDYVWVDDAVLVAFDTQVTAVTAGASAMQVARGTPVTDSAGTRTATVLFPAGTPASMQLQDGSTVQLGTFHVRATEYTVGADGPRAMPGPLPATSGYTYAVELGVDEAVMAGATSVQFERPVAFYVENFRHFPVGSAVPAGYYDRVKGAWVPSDDGRVVKVVGVANGLADLDTDGDGAADDAAGLAAVGVIEEERARLASLYGAGTSLWRVPITHFTPWDFNWPVGCATTSCPPPSLPPPAPMDPDPCSSTQAGSIIECQGQVLGERLPITGTPYSLHYQSDRAAGFVGAATIPVTGTSVPADLRRVDIVARIAGRTFRQTYAPPFTPNQSWDFRWDGRDAYGRPVNGRLLLEYEIGYVYDSVYLEAVNWYGERGFSGLSNSGVKITGTVPGEPVTLYQSGRQLLGSWDGRAAGLGGWSLSEQHNYHPYNSTLYMGDGSRVRAVTKVVSTFAGGRSGASTTDGVPATQAWLPEPASVAVGPDGTVFSAGAGWVRSVDTNGIVRTVAGLPPMLECSEGGDGTPATQACIWASAIAIGPDGLLYLADNHFHGTAYVSRVIRITREGLIQVVAGNGIPGFSGDGGPATLAQVNNVYSIALGPDGSLYLLESFGRIRKVDPSGTITTLAGNGTCSPSSPDGPAAMARFCATEIAAAPDGAIYIADTYNYNVRKISPDGVIRTIAGRPGAPTGDGGPALETRLGEVHAIALDADGSIFLAEEYPNSWVSRIRRVAPDGTISTVAGGDNGFAGDGGPAANAQFYGPEGLAVAPDGTLYVADRWNGRIRAIRSTVPSAVGGVFSVASASGDSLFVFDGNGRHLRTLDAVTGVTLFSFAYDASGALASVTDRDGLVTAIERDGTGRPTAIVAPHGQRTLLAVDDGGYLSRITNPAGGEVALTSDAGGLLRTYTDPRGFVHTFAYDAQGRLESDANPAGGQKSLSRVDEGRGYTVSLTSAFDAGTNQLWTYKVDNLATGDQRRTDTRPDGTATTTLIGKDGTTTTTAPDGSRTVLSRGPDPRFGMQSPVLSTARSVPSGLSFASSTTRSAALADPQNVLSLTTLSETTTVNGRAYTSVYDAATRTVTKRTPVGRTTVGVIDDKGRLTQLQLPGLDPMHMQYDGSGRLSAMTQGTRSSSIAYDAQGYPRSVTDPALRTSAFTYDPAGRVVAETLPGGRAVAFGYDASGNITSLSPPGRPAHGFDYTPVDLVASYAPPAVAGSGSTSYRYNFGGALSQVTLPDATAIVPAYDSAGRLASVTTARGTLHVGYDTSGRVATLTAPEGEQLTFGYDGFLPVSETATGPVAGTVSRTFDSDFRPASVALNGGTAASFQYDADGLLTQAGALAIGRDAASGRVSGTTAGAVTTSHAYSSYGELGSVSASSSGSALYSYTLTRDALGRVTGKSETAQGTTSSYAYGYDDAGRLTSVSNAGAVVESYSYDDNGNRLSGTNSAGSATGTYDAQDRMTAYGAATYTYGPSGDLRTRTAGGQTTTYSYDSLGNLMGVWLPDGRVIEYVVDGLNRRVGKKVNGAVVEGFLYDGKLRPVAWLDGTGAVKATFVYSQPFLTGGSLNLTSLLTAGRYTERLLGSIGLQGTYDSLNLPRPYVPDWYRIDSQLPSASIADPTAGLGVNVPEYMTTSAGTFRILTDHLGSPMLVVDTTSGAVVQRMDYDSFGNVLADSAPGFQSFGFAGGLYDRDTGLVRFGARDYDPAVGRWTNKDPVLFVGGTTNLYEYAGNDPLNYADPTGLASCHTKKDCYDAWKFNMMGCNTVPPNLRPACWAAASALLAACMAIAN
jgi:RHS repeat-associated protein